MSSFFPGNSVPSGTTTTDRFARELAILLGWNAPDGSLQAEDLRAWASGLADAYDTETRASDQVFANRATDLLGSWEFRLGLAVRPSASTADRQAAVGAKRAATGGDVMGRLLKAVQKIDATAGITTVSAAAVAATNPRNVFRFVITLALATLTDPDKRAAVTAVVEQMKPCYSAATLAVSRPFYLDISKLDYTAL